MELRRVVATQSPTGPRYEQSSGDRGQRLAAGDLGREAFADPMRTASRGNGLIGQLVRGAPNPRDAWPPRRRHVLGERVSGLLQLSEDCFCKPEVVTACVARRADVIEPRGLQRLGGEHVLVGYEQVVELDPRVLLPATAPSRSGPTLCVRSLTGTSAVTTVSVCLSTAATVRALLSPHPLTQEMAPVKIQPPLALSAAM